MRRLGGVIGASVLLASVLAAACSARPLRRSDAAVEPVAAPASLVEMTGGSTTARALRGRPFNQSARNLTNVELGEFAAGAEPFDQRLSDSADGLGRRRTDPLTGRVITDGPLDPASLGPSFNEDGCLACHLDATAPHRASDRDVPPGYLVRVSVPGADVRGGPLPEPTYGLQIQTAATSGRPEAKVRVTYRTITRRLGDGETVELRQPTIHLDDPVAPLAPGAMLSARMATPIIGLGLLEAIPESSLRAAAAAQAAGGTSVSGRLNTVWDIGAAAPAVGRMGWKAGQPSVHQQTVRALHDDMGVLSADIANPCDGQGSLCDPTDGSGGAGRGGPEIDDDVLSDLTFYNRTIAVPIARDVDSPKVRRGAVRFDEVGCSACHTPTQRTGTDPVAALSNQTIHPYTDLLLHDMGPGLSDARGEFLASGGEWRTAPLWGIGMREQWLGFRNFLHDGRARSLLEAIEWHDGEARGARRSFERLDRADRNDLLAFLGSL